jgi:hypothetical protein
MIEHDQIVPAESHLDRLPAFGNDAKTSHGEEHRCAQSRLRCNMVDPEKSEEYRRMAAECLLQSKRAENVADAAFLLDLAYRWHMLAQGIVTPNGSRLTLPEPLSSHTDLASQVSSRQPQRS